MRRIRTRRGWRPPIKVSHARQTPVRLGALDHLIAAACGQAGRTAERDSLARLILMSPTRFGRTQKGALEPPVVKFAIASLSFRRYCPTSVRALVKKLSY